MSATDLVRREVGYLREDVAGLAASVPRLTPARRSSLALLVGAAAIVYGVAQWWAPPAMVLTGIFALAYGAFLVDLDAGSKPGRSRSAVQRKRKRAA